MATAPSIHSSYAVVRPLYPRPCLAFVSADIFQLALSTAAKLMTINRGGGVGCRSFCQPLPPARVNKRRVFTRTPITLTNGAATPWAATPPDDGFACSVYIPPPRRAHPSIFNFWPAPTLSLLALRQDLICPPRRCGWN